MLVMVSPLPIDEETSRGSFEAGETEGIRTNYSQSCLYRNYGTASPLWTLPYEDWTHQVFMGPDGKHLVIASVRETTWSNQSDHAVTFFRKGIPLASYMYADLTSW